MGPASAQRFGLSWPSSGTLAPTECCARFGSHHTLPSLLCSPKPLPLPIRIYFRTSSVFVCNFGFLFVFLDFLFFPSLVFNVSDLTFFLFPPFHTSFYVFLDFYFWFSLVFLDFLFFHLCILYLFLNPFCYLFNFYRHSFTPLPHMCYPPFPIFGMQFNLMPRIPNCLNLVPLFHLPLPPPNQPHPPSKFPPSSFSLIRPCGSNAWVLSLASLSHVALLPICHLSAEFGSPALSWVHQVGFE